MYYNAVVLLATTSHATSSFTTPRHPLAQKQTGNPTKPKGPKTQHRFGPIWAEQVKARVSTQRLSARTRPGGIVHIRDHRNKDNENEEHFYCGLRSTGTPAVVVLGTLLGAGRVGTLVLRFFRDHRPMDQQSNKGKSRARGGQQKITHHTRGQTANRENPNAERQRENRQKNGTEEGPCCSETVEVSQAEPTVRYLEQECTY